MMSGARPQLRPTWLHGEETENFSFFIDTVECVYASAIIGSRKDFCQEDRNV